MKYLQVKNFDRYQHYQKGKNVGRNGCPTWIKLYTRLIDGDDLLYDHLTDAAKITYVHMMLLASRHRNFITYDLAWIRKRLNLQGVPRIQELIDAGFLQEVETENPRTFLGHSYESPSPEEEEEEEKEKKKRKNKTDIRDAPDKPDATPSTPADLVLTFPCSGTPKVWHLSQSVIDEWQEVFPAVNVLEDCRLAHVKIANGAVNKKTANGMRKFLVNWIARTNNSIRPQKTDPKPQSTDRTELYREAARTGGPVFVET